MGSLTEDDRPTRLDDGGFLRSDRGKGIPEDAHMVEPDSGYRDGDRIGGARGIPAATHAHLEHGNVDGGFGEHDHRGDGQKIEGRDVIRQVPLELAAGIYTATGFCRYRDAPSEGFGGDDATVHLHALLVAHELRRGVQSSAKALPP